MPRRSRGRDEPGAVLFVRADAALVRAIDIELERRRSNEPGQRVTRSDIVRSLLWERLQQEARR